jgi:uncharacterized membrane protein YphA (DoxX/SURF4 family)
VAAILFLEKMSSNVSRNFCYYFKIKTPIVILFNRFFVDYSMKNLFPSYTIKDWLLVFLRFCIGALFLFSGFVKLIPIEPFELKFIELGIASWTTAPFLARLLIAGEIFLGILLILNIKPKGTAKATLAILIFFTLYLAYDILKNGNDGNCGCFGTFIVMTPLESIVKNLLMIPIVGAILLLNKRSFNYKATLFTVILAVLSIATPFVLYPVDDVESHINANTEKVNYPFPAEKMPEFNIKGNKIDLTQGESIVAFMSVKCPHCKKAAYKLFILSQQHKLPNIYMVLIGKENQIPTFVKETKADFPYYIFNDNAFFDIAGNSMPKIFYLKNGVVKAKFDSLTITEEELLKAIQKQ